MYRKISINDKLKRFVCFTDREIQPTFFITEKIDKSDLSYNIKGNHNNLYYKSILRQERVNLDVAHNLFFYSWGRGSQ